MWALPALQPVLACLKGSHLEHHDPDILKPRVMMMAANADDALQQARAAVEQAQQTATRYEEEFTAVSAESRARVPARVSKAMAELHAAEMNLYDARRSVKLDAMWSDWGPSSAELLNEEEAGSRRDEAQARLDKALTEEGAPIDAASFVQREKEARSRLFEALSEVGVRKDIEAQARRFHV